MNSSETSGSRWRIWLVGGVLLLLLAAGFTYGVTRSPNETLLLAGSGDHSVPLEELMPVANPVPEIDVEKLSESLAGVLGGRLAEENRRVFEAFEESRRAQARMFQEWSEGFDGKFEERLEHLDQRLGSLERNMNHLSGLIEEETQQASGEPAFVFRGVEVWHGQTHALLEHEGRILPVRQGESRLGWRIHAIDRDNRKLHVGDGVSEFVLEEQ